ncbi:hypothetical protein GALMADRAFT_221382 [Galerina marginata CBS 339.88]|uniref:Uncharacterized protein n=1 Tax=Galerina marginata (strain CBS 339.88) TaxID=685588 RepID=A0A067TRD9_GALM3|nr:hypothetical protein GALMADRAFT_221382 [Galerina marginata CBS 339.88]
MSTWTVGNPMPGLHHLLACQVTLIYASLPNVLHLNARVRVRSRVRVLARTKIRFNHTQDRAKPPPALLALH